MFWFILLSFFYKFLLCFWVWAFRSCIWGQGFTYFIYAWLKSVILVYFLLFHFSDNFFLFTVLSIQPFDLINCQSLGVTFTDDFRSQIYLRLKSALLLIFRLLGDMWQIFLLFLKKCFLSRMKIFQISSKHVRILCQVFWPTRYRRFEIICRLEKLFF